MEYSGVLNEEGWDRSHQTELEISLGVSQSIRHSAVMYAPSPWPHSSQCTELHIFVWFPLWLQFNAFNSVKFKACLLLLEDGGGWGAEGGGNVGMRGGPTVTSSPLIFVPLLEPANCLCWVRACIKLVPTLTAWPRFGDEGQSVMGCSGKIGKGSFKIWNRLFRRQEQ